MVEPLIRDAVIFASLLSLLSTGLTLTYMTTKVPNFAHGSFATIGLYVALTAGKVWNSNPYLYVPLAFLLGVAAGLSLYRIILRPLMNRGASFVSLMIATIAFDMILLAIFNIYADYLTRGYGVASRYFLLKALDFKVAGMPGLSIVAPTAVAALIISLHLALTRTRFGVAMRATVENPALSSVVGINVGKVYAVSWLIAGGLGAVSGALMGMYFIGNPDVGPNMLPSIFAASIVGGLYNIYGAALGGYLVGLAEVLGTSYFSSTIGPWVIPYRPMIPLTIMVITLLLAPRGLSGLTLPSRLRPLKVRSYGSTS